MIGIVENLRELQQVFQLEEQGLLQLMLSEV
jgi:hypothetical protein